MRLVRFLIMVQDPITKKREEMLQDEILQLFTNKGLRVGVGKDCWVGSKDES